MVAKKTEKAISADVIGPYENTSIAGLNNIPNVKTLGQAGASGLWQTGGFVLDDPLPQLRGINGRRLLREMLENESTVGGFMAAFEELMMKVDWYWDPYRDDGEDPTPADEEQAAFMQSCFDDLKDGWHANLSGMMNFLGFGWSWHEIMYKKRQGPNDPDAAGNTSKYEDGLFGWQSFALRAQDSLWNWVFDASADVVAMVQRDPTTGKFLTIPREKSILIRTTIARGNPEGRSILRNAVTDYLFLRRIREFEAIGIERDLAGLPIAYAPAEWFGDDATDDQKAALQQLVKIVQGVKRNEQEGIVFPMLIEDGQPMFKFELLSSGGQRQFNTGDVINRYRSSIASTVLADFLTLGHEGVGSFSLGISKIDLFTSSVEHRVRTIAEVINNDAVPKLLNLNGMDVSRPAKLRYGAIAEIDLTELSVYILALAKAGLITPDPSLEEYLRKVADLPANDAEADAAAYARGPQVPEAPKAATMDLPASVTGGPDDEAPTDVPTDAAAVPVVTPTNTETLYGAGGAPAGGTVVAADNPTLETP